MMRWWKHYRLRKHARELVSGARKHLRMHWDILDPRQIKRLGGICTDLDVALHENRPHLIVELVGSMEKELARSFPQTADSAWRENVEVFLVAAIVAMAVRSFFIQPFKIPTGSMQPTLYGLYEMQDYDRRASLPGRIVDCLFLGQWPTVPEAKMPQAVMNFVGWLGFGRWPIGASCIMRGDHIFVDRFTYHFRAPQRGDVVVFDTNDVAEMPEAHRNKFYIKRLVGLGGDRIQIKPPYLYVNGERANGRRAFDRIHSCQNGYNGYIIPDAFPPARYFNSEESVYTVYRKEYFVLGDNSRSSWDSRFWGTFPRKALIGRAVFVYWPFSHRFGGIE